MRTNDRIFIFFLPFVDNTIIVNVQPGTPLLPVTGSARFGWSDRLPPPSSGDLPSPPPLPTMPPSSKWRPCDMTWRWDGQGWERGFTLEVEAATQSGLLVSVQKLVPRDSGLGENGAQSRCLDRRDGQVVRAAAGSRLPHGDNFLRAPPRILAYLTPPSPLLLVHRRETWALS